MSGRGRPNILLVHWHDLGRHLGTYGHRRVPSPQVDRLAEQGLRFDNAFCTAPLCSPARGSLFTGRYPHHNGLAGLSHLGWEYRSGVRTLPSLLGQAGYRTALAGMQQESSDPATLGYQELIAVSGTRLERVYCDDVTDAARAWLARAALDERPFFLSAGFEEAHRPYPADRYPPDDPARVEVPPFLPDNEWTRDDLASFQGSIRAADAATGRLLSSLDDLGLTGSTWVVFTTDHGIAFPRAKSTLYDPGTGVALIMRPPAGRRAPAGPTDRLFSHVDLVPTVLDLLGLLIPHEVQGVSHAEWLSGGDPAPVRRHVFTEKNFHDIYDPIRAVRDREYKYIRNFEQRPLLPLPGDLESSPTRHGYGDAHLAHRPAEELYDLRQDPWEQHNVAGHSDYAPVRARLAERLESWQVHTRDPLRDGPLLAEPWPRLRRYGALVEEE